jgi:hypothetical protein
METMTISEQWSDQELTIDDLDALPDSRLRYELDDGVLVVSRHPAVPGHDQAVCPGPDRAARLNRGPGIALY